MEVHVSLPVLLLLVGFAYIILFGGLALLRREGLSLRFAIEALVITGLFSGLAALTGISVHPVFFLLFLYLVTMRVRLLVDIGTFLARRGRFSQAERVYQLAARLWPDQTGSLVIQVNRGTAFLQSGKLDEAIAVLNSVLEKSGQGYLGVKYEVAAHYNLAVAYLRKNKEAQAIIEFNAVLDTWPASEYARRAAQALEQLHHKNNPESA
jgi:tetratricopeptide (TPR) repeat protein